jgi:hypothetical protein
MCYVIRDRRQSQRNEARDSGTQHLLPRLRYANNMTGFNALPMADEAASEGSAQWAGVAKVLGPPWARFPAVTVGFVGVQVMWSIEMAYGEQSEHPSPTDVVLTQQVV